METPSKKVVINSRFLFDSVEHSLTSPEDDIIMLGVNEARILKLMIQKPDSVLSREEICQHVWRERGGKIDSSSLTQSISLLRKLLSDKASRPEYIKTVSRVGYRFIARVEPMFTSIAEEATSVARAEKKVQPDATDGKQQSRANGDCCDVVARRLSQWITPLMALLITSLLLIDFNGSQGMLGYIYRKMIP